MIVIVNGQFHDYSIYKFLYASMYIVIIDIVFRKY